MGYFKKYWWIYILVFIMLFLLIQYKREKWPFENEKADGKPCIKNINAEMPPILNEHWPSDQSISVEGIWKNGECVTNTFIS